MKLKEKFEKDDKDKLYEIRQKYKSESDNYEVAFKQKALSDWVICYRPQNLAWRRDFDYQLIHKKHKDIIETYLKSKDKNIKMKYKWSNCYDGLYNNIWTDVPDNFIKHYDERMELKLIKKFQPFTFNIEIKTLDDLKSILNRFNLDEDYFKEISKEKQLEYYDVCSDIDEKIWGSLRDKLDEFE